MVQVIRRRVVRANCGIRCMGDSFSVSVGGYEEATI